MKTSKAHPPSITKINNNFVKFFEKEQKDWGTKVALGNVFWLIGSELMTAAGVRNIHTTYKKKV